MSFLTVFMFAKDNRSNYHVFPVLQITYHGKDILDKSELASIIGIAMQIFNGYKFTFIPRPTLIITVNPQIRTILHNLKWHLPKDLDMKVDLVRCLNVPVSLFCEGLWEFGTAKIELDDKFPPPM
jgi:hypothetical protein